MIPQLDNLTAAMDRKWGVDRLPDLMPPAWRTRYAALRSELNEAIEAGAPTDATATALFAALQKMDAKATEQGSFPLDPTCIEIRRGGMIYAIAPDAETARACSLTAQWEQREVTVYLADALLDAALANPTLQAIHASFPGAVVSASPTEFRPGKRKADLGRDEIPFGGDEEGEAA